MSANVIKFAPRAAPLELPLEFVELRLSDEGCNLQMTLFDRDHNVVAVLEFALSSKPANFDLELLHAAWEHWRGSTGLAS
jgi:hypothetical protein